MIEQEQIHAGRLNGNCKHSGFVEYDSLSGYVTKEYVSEWTGADGTRYRKVCQIINLGRPDRGVPVDPDKELQYEPLETEDKSCDQNRAAMIAVKEKKAARDVVLIAQMQEALREHGPLSGTYLAKHLGVSQQRVLQLLRRNREQFSCAGGRRPAWSLK